MIQIVLFEVFAIGWLLFSLNHRLPHTDKIREAVSKAGVDKVPDLFVVPIVFRGRFENDREIGRVGNCARCHALRVAVFLKA